MNKPADAHLQIAALSPMMYYLSGRLDAADRRAEFTVAIALAVLGFTVAESTQGVEITPSLLLFVAAIGLGLWAARPRSFKSLSWISQIFLGSITEDIRSRMAGSEEGIVTEMLLGQQDIAALIRKKNASAAWAMLAVALGSCAFLLGF